ncbi:hypothetical protein PI124_g6241 [Phytophthora idaei]|nr:hypothetical protein PI125_g13314 [Phytophthora idaei]KAG3133584.1 hypothetical protein PI126_g19113 [Phytophthora idaei]KAG3249067.1 hypothetical protein PI124_g6241 [Phytophthora idaei]
MSNELKFPRNFMCGTATALYQVEGAVNKGGRGDSTCDGFSRTPGNVVNGDTGEKAVGHYHQYEKDLQLIKNMGLKVYCLAIAIAWPRSIPVDIVMLNEEGVELYNNVINELLTEYDSWPGGMFIQDAFAQYARVCFQRFRDRIKNCLTLNEPWCSAVLGYCSAILAPGRKCKLQTEAYLAGHNLLLAHARAVKVYRNKFQAAQKGGIGITLDCVSRHQRVIVCRR